MKIAPIGHNTPPVSPLALRFSAVMEKMKVLGLKGEVAVSAGIVMFSTTDKSSAQQARKAIKVVCKKANVVSTETRPVKGAYVFTIIC